MPDTLDDTKPSEINPALVGAAIYAGIPIVGGSLLSIPETLTDLVRSGVPIKAEGWTPLKEIAEFSRDEVRKIQNFARESGVKVPIVASSVPELQGRVGHFFPEELPTEKLIGKVVSLLGGGEINRDPSHIGLATTSLPHAFHEIGHGSPIAGSETARRVLHDLSGMSRGTLGALARAGILGTALMPRDEDGSSTSQFVNEHAPALVGATYLPELAEEARASTKALMGARRHGIGTLQTLKELTPAFGSYLAGAAAPVLATLIAQKVVKALRSKQEEKTAAAKPGTEVRAPGILRATAASAWKVGGPTPPKPKTIKPNEHLGSSAKTREPAKPPSNRQYYKDLLQSLYNPQRGFRIATQG